MKMLFTSGEGLKPEHAFAIAEQHLWQKMESYPGWGVTTVSHDTTIRNQTGKIVDLETFDERAGVQQVFVVTLLAYISRKLIPETEIEGP